MSLELGQESSVTLDASLSLDQDRPDTPLASNFTYLWFCETMQCNSLTSTLLVTKAMREERGLNKVGDVVRVGLQIRYLGKESALTYVNIKVVPQDYSKCLEIRIANAINDEVRLSR